MALPEKFLEQLDALGHDAYKDLPGVIEEASPSVSLRINPARCTMPPFPDSERVTWNPYGYYLSSRPDFTLDPRMHQGFYYVQEASSMAVHMAVKRAIDIIDIHSRPFTVLDACAAPGGKTTAAIDALPHDAFVVANEFDSRRVHILSENLAKWGVNASITHGDASKMTFPKSFFDIIIADLPCSGEGMMRKDSFAVEQWSPDLVCECRDRQRAIIDNIWDSLAPNGVLIYSTCTFNLAENEEIISYLISTLGGEPLDISLNDDNVLGAMAGFEFPALRFVPGRVRGEGLFMALIHKPGISPDFNFKSKSKLPKVGLPFRLSDILIDDYTLVNDNPLRAVPVAHLPFYELFSKHVKIFSGGIEIGSLKGKDFIPSQQLALSRSFRRGYFNEAQVDAETALRYLRRESVVLPEDAPRGIVLLTFLDRPLGWVKNLGNRANNLYPDNWRIRFK